MKKVILSVFLLFLILVPVSASAEVINYENADSGVVFTLPDGWTENTQSKMYYNFPVSIYDSSDNAGEKIIYAYRDFWSDSGKSYQLFHRRSALTDSFLSDEELLKTFESTFGNGSRMSVVSHAKSNYNNREYRQYLFKVTPDDASQKNVMLNMNFRISNGIGYFFSYSYPESGALHEQDFETLMASVTYKEPSLAKNDAGFFSIATSAFTDYLVELMQDGKIIKLIPTILLVLLLTFFLYFIPLFFYRHLYLNKPLAKRKAVKVSLIYTAAVFVADAAVTLLVFKSLPFTFPAALIWGFIDYKILVSGVDKTAGGYVRKAESAMKENSDTVYQLQKEEKPQASPLPYPDMEKPVLPSAEPGYFPKSKTVLVRED